MLKNLKRGVKSPTGKDNWPKRSIEEMLSNEKYIGIAVVNVDGEEGQIYKLNILIRQSFQMKYLTLFRKKNRNAAM